MRKHSIKVFLVRRRVVAVLAALALAAGIFYAVSYPGSVSAAAAKRQLPIYSVERTDGKFCSISFDAAWGNEDTQILIDILARYDIKATFFVVGDWAEKYPESVKALHDAGHEVMSHSNHHDHYNTLTAEQIIADVTASNERISASTGHNVDTLARRLRALLLDDGSHTPPSDGLAPNARQSLVLERALHELDALLADIAAGSPYDCCSVRLDAAAALLGEVTGLDSPEEVLNRVFSSFCIGK